MNMAEFELTRLPVGGVARVVGINAEGLIRNRLLDLGLVPSTVIEAVRRSPAGDPVAYKIRGALIALRSEESRRITVRSLE
jgi:ferrous iron transport protein A